MALEVLVGSPEAMAAALVERLTPLVPLARSRHGRFALALSGGSVAEAFFPRLAAATLEWAAVDFFWGDERAVPPDHVDSNHALARRLLLDPLGVSPARVHRMKGESADLASAAAEYEREMIRVLGDPPCLDAVLLGVGPDGHVCSLFPGHPALEEDTRSVVAVSDSPKPPPGRITLTLCPLAAAGVVFVGAFGEGKAEVVRSAVEDRASTLPVARAARGAGRAVFLLDPAAASRLANRG